jgi:hypothetical protein
MRPWILLGLVGVSACEDKGIGLPCELESQTVKEGKEGGVSPPATTQVIAQAVECPESICIQMAGRPPTKAGDAQPQAYCTATCSNDSDCEGGENCWREDPKNPDRRTKMRYRCVQPIVIATRAEGDESEDTGLFCDGLCVCEADARRQTNPVVMEPDRSCRQANPQLCEDWNVVTPPQCDDE